MKASLLSTQLSLKLQVSLLSNLHLDERPKRCGRAAQISGDVVHEVLYEIHEGILSLNIIVYLGRE